MPKKFRSLCVAVHHNAPDPKIDQIEYIVYKPEIGDETKRLHYQTYVVFKTSYDRKNIVRILGIKDDDIPDENTLDTKCRTRGSPFEASEYVKKQETTAGPIVEYGILPERKQGKRNDIHKLTDKIKKGANLEDIANENPEMILRYGKGIKELIAIREQEKTNTFRHVETYCIWGDAEAGKTRIIYEKEGYENCFKLDKSKNEVWFDGYNGQNVLIIDDFYGWIEWGHLLNILDGYPLKLQVKGCHTWAKWSKVYITSNKPYTDWYSHISYSSSRDKDIIPLKRRIKYDMHMTKTEHHVRAPKVITNQEDFFKV